MNSLHFMTVYSDLSSTFWDLGQSMYPRRKSTHVTRLTKRGTQPSNARSCRDPAARSKGRNISARVLRHDSNSRPRPFAYSPPWWNCLNAARITQLPSGSMRSKEENSSSSSSSVAFTDAFAAAAMASMMILRRCCQQSPKYVLYFRSRSSSVMASHAALPTFASTATIAAAATMRRVQRAPLHVSVMRTVSSHNRCRPMFSGAGPPAAAQLPAPFSFTCCAIHAARTRRE